MKRIPIIASVCVASMCCAPVFCQEIQNAFLSRLNSRLNSTTYVRKAHFEIESLDDLKGLSPAALLDVLKTKRIYAPCVTVSEHLQGWIRAEDLEQLAQRLDSGRACMNVHPAWSSFSVSSYSTEGAEAAQMILGFAQNNYPFVLNMDDERKTTLVKEAKVWLAKQLKQASSRAAESDTNTSLCNAEPDLFVVKNLNNAEWSKSITRAIRRSWFPPRDGGVCKVRFVLAANGTVSNLRISSSSGQAVTDRAALEAITNAKHFFALPAGSDSLEIEFSFDYNVWDQHHNSLKILKRMPIRTGTYLDN